MGKKVFGEGYSYSGFERDKLFINTGAGKFLDVSGVSGADSAGDGRALVAADFDDDGAPDLFVHNLQAERQILYRNRLGGKNRFVRLSLEGRRSNRDAIGAVVTARLPGPGPAVLRRQVDCGSGYLASGDKRLLFGLGRSEYMTGTTIRWPSGLVQGLGRLDAGKSYHVVEGEAPRENLVRPSRLGGERPQGLQALAGKPMPAIALRGLDGRPLAMPAGWRLYNLWSPGCLPCRKEMPALEALARRLAPRLTVIGIALEPEARGEAVREAAGKLGVTYPICLAPADLGARLGAGPALEIPASLLVDPRGSIARVFVGTADLADLEAEIRAGR